MSNETTIKSIVNENISMKIFLSNMEQKHEHEKEATVDEIVNKHLIVETFSLFRKTFVKPKHKENAKRKLCQSQTWK